MVRKIISTIGLGILGIDPVTAIYILIMGLKMDSKIKITAFFFSFAIFSILLGAIISSLFGLSVLNFINGLIPNDNSNIWIFIEIGILIIILIWIGKRAFGKKKKTKREEKQISGSMFKYITTGFIFALTSFTDPTYYAVIVLGSEVKSFLVIFLLLAIWFIVSQFMAVIVYLAIEFNLVNKLTKVVDKIKIKYEKAFSMCFNIILVVVALLLLIDLIYICLD